MGAHNNPGTLTMHYTFYGMLLLFEIYMYLQINPKKQTKWYLLTSANKFEVAYLVFIILLFVTAFICFVLAFFKNINVGLDVVRYSANSILAARWVLLWYYAKDEMDHHKLADGLRDSKHMRCLSIEKMKKARTAGTETYSH